MSELEKDYSAEIRNAQNSLRAGRFGEAISGLQNVLKENPEHTDALYMCAVAQRYAKDYSSARKTLARLKSSLPEYGRAFQEEAHIHRDLNEQDLALRAYQQACLFNPGLEASWKGQANILRAKGQHVDAANAQGHCDRLLALPRELHAVTNLIHEGNVLKAETLCKNYMQKDKQNVEGMRLLADIASRLNANDEAEFLYATATELAPGNVMIRLDYVTFLRKMQRFEDSLGHAKFLNDNFPGNPMLQSVLAVQSQQVGDFETAFDMFDRVLEKNPNDPITLTSRGHALKTFGRQEDAVASYQRATKVKPDHGDAYFSLSNLKTYKFSDEEVATMERVLSPESMALKNQANFNFSLGKAYEDRNNFEKAFSYYERGNECRRLESGYDADKMSRELQDQIDICSTSLFANNEGSGHKAPDPIFILGLPRAGSTLLEQIIASHSQVDGTLELPNILALSNKLRGKTRKLGESDYPAVLNSLDADKFEHFGKSFIEDTRIHRQNAPFFIDKMPNNFRHIGLIHLILPNAKIIDARRHPMACCFSGFKQLFAEGQEFTYGLKQIGQYYKDYVALMDHWDEVLPDKVLRVQYEDVVTDTESQVRRMLEYLDLPFEQACVDFHETKRSVRTASSEQVRQPIFKSGLEQWRNFEPWLDPLKEALGPVLERYPID